MNEVSFQIKNIKNEIIIDIIYIISKKIHFAILDLKT